MQKLGELALVDAKSSFSYTIDLMPCLEEKKNILDALVKANLNLNPQIHQNIITLALPKITREHRENVARSARLKASQVVEKMKKIEAKTLRKAQDAKGVSDDLIFKTGQYVKIFD